MDDNDVYFGGHQTPKFDRKKKSGGFQSMGLLKFLFLFFINFSYLIIMFKGFAWQILKAILNSGYKQPTPIQRKVLMFKK